jgi:hypothetical protein
MHVKPAQLLGSDSVHVQPFMFIQLLGSFSVQYMCVYGCSQKKQSSEGPSLLVACMSAFSAAQWISFIPKAQPVLAPQPGPALQPIPVPQPAPKPQPLLAAVLPGGDAAAGAAGVEAMPAAAKDGEQQHKVGPDLSAYQSNM